MKREGKMIVRRAAMTLLLAVLTAATAWAQEPGETEANPFVVTTWADLKAKMALDGYIRLDANVTDPDRTSSSYLYVPSDKTVTLDLNGHTINRGLTQQTDYGFVIMVDGTLTLNDSSNPSTGTITGGYDKGFCDTYNHKNYESGGGVFVTPTGSFIMNGGTITGNKSPKYGGGGVYVGRGGLGGDKSAPSWVGKTYYKIGIGGTLYVPLDDLVTGYPTPEVSISGTYDSRTGEDIDPHSYTITQGLHPHEKMFSFNAGTDGITESTYAFIFHAENDNGGDIDQEVVIAVCNAPVWQSTPEIPITRPSPDLQMDFYFDFGTTNTINLHQYVSGDPDPAIALDDDHTAANPDKYNFDAQTGILTLKPVYKTDFSSTPVHIIAFTAKNVYGEASMVIYTYFRAPDTPPEPKPCSFVMNGGTITGNSGKYGGGVCLDDRATFEMNGGTISGNTISSNTALSGGGGVYAYWDNAIIVSGSPVVSGNTGINGKADNVYLSNENQAINVSGALSADARIGVTTEETIDATDVVTITSRLSGKGTRANFLSDDDDLALVTTASGELALATAYTVTVPDDVTVSGLTPTAANTYKVGYSDVVTLNVPAGYVITSTSYNDGTDHEITPDANGIYSFTMPTHNVTASVVWRSTGTAVEVSYIDENGKTQTAQAIALDGTEDELAEGWYFVGGNVTYGGDLYINAADDVNIILCDGATLTTLDIESRQLGDKLTIYGQSQNTGTANINGSILADISLTVNGGTINAGDISSGGGIIINGGTINTDDIDAYNFLDFNGGTVNVGGDISLSNQNIQLNGGTVTVTGKITADVITLAGSTVKANDYYAEGGGITIANGLIYSDGTTSSSVFAKLDASKALTPVGATVTMNASGIRTYANTVALDFTGIDGLTAYIVSAFDGTAGTLTLTPVSKVPAHTGLLLKGTANTAFDVPVAASASAPAKNYLMGVTKSSTIVGQTEERDNVNYTNFILANGTYGIDWYTLSTAGAIGANKAYLSLPTADLNLSSSSRFTWVYENGETGIVPTPYPSRAEGESGYYTLSGQRLTNGQKPTQKGLYIQGGRKVVIK